MRHSPKKMEIISKINDAVYSVVGGVPMIAVLLVTGIFCTFLLKGIQFRKFGASFKATFGKSEGGSKANTLTPFQALCTSLASTVGTGNIAGVAGGIAIGGPGAVFWMWIAAVLGMATKYSEIVLALRYREKNKSGEWAGGPMYYIKNGLGKYWKWMAYFFCGCCALAAFGTGNMAQINTMTATVTSVVDYFAPAAASYDFIIKLGLGILVAVSAVLVLFGGINRIGKVTEKMTPIMSGLYIGGALLIVAVNYRTLGDVFRLIVTGAFKPAAIGGGLAGVTVIKTMEMGIGRGIFSNEAGLGSSVIAHSASETREPVKQGLWGIFEVFFDTFVICTLTALMFITTNYEMLTTKTADELAKLDDSTMALNMFSENFGVFGTVCYSIILPLFAFTTIMAWSYYGEKACEFCFKWVKSERTRKICILMFKILYVVFIVAAAIISGSLVWDIDDTFNGLMAFPNLVALVLMSGKVAKITKNYYLRKKGKNVEPMLSAYPEMNEEFKKDIENGAQ